MARHRLDEDHALESRVIEEHNAWRAKGVASDGSGRMSRAPAQAQAPPAPTGQANTTDPDSRNNLFRWRPDMRKSADCRISSDGRAAHL